jgi:hypothetical protein
MEEYKKSITTVVLTIGLLIFVSVVWLKIDSWAKQQQAAVSAVAAESGWDGYLYRKTVSEILENK